MTTDGNSHSLQRRLLTTMAVAFALLLVLISALLWTYARAAANRTQDVLLAGAALAILERVSVRADGASVDLPNSAMDILALNPVDRVQYRVFVPGQRNITGTSDLPLTKDLVPSIVPAFYDAAYKGATYRFVVQGRQVITPGGRIWVAVQVGQTVEERGAQQWSFFATGLAGLAVLSLIGLGSVWLAIRTSLAPLRQIASDLALREPGDLDLVGGTPPREIRGLFDAINGFIVRLQRSRTLTETFIADVAHQTRTSLSALQGHLSLAVDAKNADQMRARLVKADRQALRMVRLTNQLLANAMVIHRSDKVNLQPVALKPLVRETLAESLRDSRLRKISLSFVDDDLGPEADMILGDEVSIREALRNLIENAVRHGPADNTVTITLASDETRVCLSVEDAGPGIAEEDLPRATARFTSLSDQTKGSGLGLSIVKAVAEGHGADIELSRSVLGGLNVTLIFQRLAILFLFTASLLSPTGKADAQTLLIHSATDPPAMQPIIEAFKARNPGVEVDYVEYQTVSLHQSMLEPAVENRPDLVISSAMDLQVDLVNRGLARRIDLASEIEPPSWAVWRSELFGFTFEPAVVVYDRRAIREVELPSSHRDMATFVRDNEDRFRGRIGSYDIRSSGIGYLYATQDSLQGPQAISLLEVLGRAGLKTYCCTSDMVDATAAGILAFAFNTIGSYASEMTAKSPYLGLHLFDDYNLVMSRTVFIPVTARNPELGERFIRFLLSREGQRVVAEKTPLLPLIPSNTSARQIETLIRERHGSFLPIRLTPGLLTYLDALKRQAFLSAWDTSLGRGP